MLEFDKKFLAELETTWVQKLKVFFIEAGCSGTKIQMETEFEVTDDLVEIPLSLNPSLPEGEREEKNLSPNGGKMSEGQIGGIHIYAPNTDKKFLENANITRVMKADHTGIEQTRYIFTSDEVEERCGCGTSFAFEKSVPTIDVEKLKSLRKDFRKN